MFDIDQFEERAAIMEHNGGLSQFAAETAAAKAQGKTRWEAMNAVRMGHSAKARNHSEATAGQPADNLPAMQRGTEKQNRPLSERGVQA